MQLAARPELGGEIAKQLDLSARSTQPAVPLATADRERSCMCDRNNARYHSDHQTFADREYHRAPVSCQ